MPIVASAHDLTATERALTLAGVLTGLFVAAVEQTIVVTAGPDIQRDLALSTAAYPWLTTAYLVTSTTMVPIWGKLSDQVGRRRVVFAGLAVFAVGSAMAATAQGALVLFMARAIQGVGAAALFTSAFAVVGSLFPPAVWGRYQGFVMATIAAASLLGPIAGGMLTDLWGWRAVFWVNLPLCALSFAFVWKTMPADGRSPGLARVDVAGALLLIAAVVPLLVVLSADFPQGDARGPSLSRAEATALLGLAAVFAGAFCWHEGRAAEPIVPLSFFRTRTVAVAGLGIFLVGFDFLAAMVFLPLYLVNVTGVSATRSGLALMPLLLAFTMSNILAGQWVARSGRYKRLMLIGLVVLAAGAALLWAGPRHIVLAMAMMGTGLGASLPLFLLAAQNVTAPRDVGMATATITFVRQLGSSLGVAALGWLFANALARRGGGSDGFTAATSALYGGIAVVSVLCFCVTLALPENPLRAEQAPR